MSKRKCRNIPGKARRSRCSDDKFRERKIRSLAEAAEVDDVLLPDGGKITGPLSIIQLLQSHGAVLHCDVKDSTGDEPTPGPPA